MKTTSFDIESIKTSYQALTREEIATIIEESDEVKAMYNRLEELNIEALKKLQAINKKVAELQALYPHCKYQFIKRTIRENNEADALAILAGREKQNLKNLSNERDIEARRREQVAKAYEAIATGTIEATLDNIKVVGEYLRTQNWGSWTLPAMSIGYSALQYDCEGQTAVAFIFNSPVEGYKKIAVGAKRGHLNGYYHI
jgi:hypothetical protein